MMIDFLKLRTDSQEEILKLKCLDLLPDLPKKGLEKWKLNDRIKFEFRQVHEKGEFIGYAYVNVIVQPHYLINEGIHNGNDFSPAECIDVLTEVFNCLDIQKSDLSKYDIVNIEFGVNVIPESNIKEIIDSIKFWKRKPYVRNKADFSKITKSSLEKQIKVYAKGIDAIERLKTTEVHPNTFRIEIKEKKKRKINLSANQLFKEEVYLHFQHQILADLDFSLFVQNCYNKSGLSRKEKIDIREFSRLENWQKYLSDMNRDKFHYQRKKYEKICRKIPNLKDEVQQLIDQKFTLWKNSAKSPKNITQKQIVIQEDIINKFCKIPLTRT